MQRMTVAGITGVLRAKAAQGPLDELIGQPLLLSRLQDRTAMGLNEPRQLTGHQRRDVGNLITNSLAAWKHDSIFDVVSMMALLLRVLCPLW